MATAVMGPRNGSIDHPARAMVVPTTATHRVESKPQWAWPAKVQIAMEPVANKGNDEINHGVPSHTSPL